MQLVGQPLAISRSHTFKPADFQALLIFVAFHPNLNEVNLLESCLSQLPKNIGFVVVANDYRPNEAVEELAASSFLFLRNTDNIGYGRAVNHEHEYVLLKNVHFI